MGVSDLYALARIDRAAREPRLAQVVEMRYFGGLNEQEIAAALDVTDRTLRRDWGRRACCWPTPCVCRSNSAHVTFFALCRASASSIE